MNFIELIIFVTHWHNKVQFFPTCWEDHNLTHYTLKIGPCDVMSNTIKDLSMSSSSSIGFEVKWHSSRSDKWY